MPSEVIITEKELPSEVIRAIAAGRKIEAIKILRESTGLGLANAKVLVDRASRVHGPKKEFHAGQSGGQSTRLVVSVLLILALGAAFLYLA